MNPRTKIVYTLPFQDHLDTSTDDHPSIPTSGHRLGINALACAPWSDSSFVPSLNNSSLLSSGRDGHIIGWSLPETRPRSVNNDSDQMDPVVKGSANLLIRGHLDWVNDLAVPTLNYTTTPSIISASNDRSIRLWRLHASDDSNLPISANGYEVGYHNDYAKCLAYAPAAQFLISGGLDRKIGVWDFGHEARGNIGWLSTMDATPKQSIYTISTNKTGSMIVSGSPDKLIRIWDPRIMSKVGQLVGHTDHVRSVVLAPDAMTVLSASSDRTIKLWSLHTNRCISTYAFHSDSVWKLVPTFNAANTQISGFYSAGRDGYLFQTRFDSPPVTNSQSSLRPVYHDPPSRTTALVFQNTTGEQHSNIPATSSLFNYSMRHSCGIHHLAALNGLIFAATPSSTIYGWRDLAQHDWDKVISAQIQLFADNCEISTAIGNTCTSSENLQAGPTMASLSNVINSDWIDTLAGSVNAVRTRFIVELPGWHGLTKHSLLSNRRHVLTMNTAGVVELWDIICCVRCRSFGQVDFDATYSEVNVPEYNSNWCSANTRIGSLSVQLSEQQCFDAEMYLDEVKIEGVECVPDQRTNIGRWVLISLFRNYIQEIKGPHNHLSCASSVSDPQSNSSTKPSTSSAESSNYTKHPLPLIPNSPPNMDVSAALSTLNPGDIPISGSPMPFHSTRRPTIEDVDSIKGRDIIQSVSKPTPCSLPNVLTCNNSPSKVLSTQSQSLVSRLCRLSHRRLGSLGIEISDSEVIPEGLVTQSEPCSPIGSPKIRPLKTSRSHQNSPVFGPSAFVYASLPRDTLPDLPSKQENPGLQISDTLHKDETKVLIENSPSTNHELNVTAHQQEPSVSTSTINANGLTLSSYLPIPNETIIAIMEDNNEACSPQAKWVGTVGTCGKSNMKDLIEAIPRWLSDLLTRDYIPGKDPVKIGFQLSPDPGSNLPELKFGNQRLLANRLVRIRRVLAYIVTNAGIIVPGHNTPVEQYLELIVSGVTLDPLLTLATVRTYMWRPGPSEQGSDLIATYRLKSVNVMGNNQPTAINNDGKFK